MHTFCLYMYVYICKYIYIYREREIHTYIYLRNRPIQSRVGDRSTLRSAWHSI